MWGIATQAGAGIAIAGITATYYALANRNYRDEQERMLHEIGDGDGPDVRGPNKDVEENKDDIVIPSTPPNKVLKKELQELSFLSGSVSGLNILYQQHSPLSKFPRSTFEITPINSGAAFHPSTVFAPSDDGIIALDGDAELLPVAEMEDNTLAVANEHFEMSEDNTEDSGEVTITPANIENQEKSHKPNENAKRSVGQKWKSAQEYENLSRTTSSPICVFKNPGFGNKYSFKEKQEEKPVVTLVSLLQNEPGLETNEESGPEQSVALSSPNNENNESAEFILSPTLSQSNISVFDKDTSERLLEDDENNNTALDLQSPPPDFSSTPAYTDKIINRRLVTKLRKRSWEDRSKNRIWIRADPGATKIRQVLKRSRKPPKPSPEMDGSSAQDKYEKIIITKPEDYVALWEKKLEENDKRFHANLRDKVGCPMEGVVEEPLLLPSTISGSRLGITSSVESIETGSKDMAEHCLPVQVYNTAMGTMPWPLVGICALVVVIAGFFGMFLVKLANNVSDSKGAL